MRQFSRGMFIRYIIGSLVGIGVGWGIQEYGFNYALSHGNQALLLQFLGYYFLSRLPWVALAACVLALVGILAAVRMPYNEDPGQMIFIIGFTQVLGIALIVAIQEFIFMGVAFFPNFFITLALNVGFFLLVSLVPFVVAFGLLRFLANVTQPSRSARAIMPPELLKDFDQGKRVK